MLTDPARRIRTYSILLTVAGVIVATVLFLSPAIPGGAPKINDKLAHGIVFFALALPCLVAGWPARRWVIAGLVVYGGLIELVQPLAGRSRDLGDMLANLAGISAAILLAPILRRILPRRLRRATQA